MAPAMGTALSLVRPLKAFGLDAGATATEASPAPAAAGEALDPTPAAAGDACGPFGAGATAGALDVAAI